MIECHQLKVWYPIRGGVLNRVRGHVRAVDDVSLAIGEGQTVGLVGESGCGKTTLGRAVAGLEAPTAGQIRYDGRLLAAMSRPERQALRRSVQMIFQDPFSSLDPRVCAMDIITEGLPGLGRAQRRQRAGELLAEVGLQPDALMRYPHEFSGGQRQRLSIARALAPQPRFVVCDEPVSALDVSVQAQIIKLLIALRQSRSLSYLFISHDLSVVRLLAQQVAVMYLGRIVEIGPAEEVLSRPVHPYTRALVAAIPVPGAPRDRHGAILEGELPSPANPPGGCAFHTRCPCAVGECAAARPALRQCAPGHQVACCRMQ